MAHYPQTRDLQLLLALARHKHFTEAAQEYGISQPAFSARIRKLEDDLGVPIVRRGNKFMGFTREGEIVLKWARQILTNAEGLMQDLSASKDGLQGALVLGVIPTALPYAANLSTELHLAYPKLTIEIQSLTSIQVERGLRDFSLDAGITYEDDNAPPDIVFDSIYTERYVLLTPAKLAPRQSGSVTWAEAAAMPLCLLSKDMRFRRIIEEVFQQGDIKAEPVMETNAFTAALAQVTNGAAATIAPQKLVENLNVDEAVVWLKLVKPALERTIGLAALDYEPVLPALEALKRTVNQSS